MYEGDTPNAERRAAALSLDRELLRELLGQEELRDLIDPGALAQVEDDLQFLSDMRRATGRDGLHDVLRGVGDLTVAEAQLRVLDGLDATSMLSELLRERRAIKLRLAGEERWIDAADAGLYRDALGAAPPGGLPAVFLEDVPDALTRLVRRYAATHGPFTSDDLRARYGVDCTAALSGLERGGDLVRGELRPGGSEREWCDPEVLRRLRRASLAVLRKEVEPVDARALARFLPAWQGVDRHPATGAGVDRLREVLVPLQGLALPVEVWERDVLPRRTGAYSPAWMDQLCAAGELVWIGAGPLGRHSGRVVLYFREDLAVLGPPSQSRGAGAGAEADGSELPAHEAVRARLAAGACFFTDLLVDVEASPEEIQEALWDLAWAGEATNDAFAPLRAPRLTLARAQRERVRGGGAARTICRPPAGRRSLGAGPGALVADRAAVPGVGRSGGPAAGRVRVAARALRHPHPRAGAGRGSRRRVRRDLSGALATRDAGRGAPWLLRRGSWRGAVRAARRGGAAARPRPATTRLRPSWPRSIRRSRSARCFPGPRARTTQQTHDGRRAWRAPTSCWPAASRSCTWNGADGGCRRWSDPTIPGSSPRCNALVEQVRAGRLRRLALEKVDGESALVSPLGPALVALGFQQGPRRLTLERLRPCPRATRLPTRRIGSGRCSRAACRTRSTPRSHGTRSIAGRRGCAGAR